MAYYVAISILSIVGVSVVLVYSYKMFGSNVFAVGVVREDRAMSRVATESRAGLEGKFFEAVKAKCEATGKTPLKKFRKCPQCGLAQTEGGEPNCVRCNYCHPTVSKAESFEFEISATFEENRVAALQKELKSQLEEMEKRVRKLELDSVHEFQEPDDVGQTLHPDVIH